MTWKRGNDRNGGTPFTTTHPQPGQCNRPTCRPMRYAQNLHQALLRRFHTRQGALRPPILQGSLLYTPDRPAHTETNLKPREAVFVLDALAAEPARQCRLCLRTPAPRTDRHSSRCWPFQNDTPLNLAGFPFEPRWQR